MRDRSTCYFVMRYSVISFRYVTACYVRLWAVSESGEVGRTCRYPGCTRSIQASDPAVGRPNEYCGKSDSDGGPVHNRFNSWRARRAAGTAAALAVDDPVQAERSPSPSVSMARVTLEQHLADLPGQVRVMCAALDAIVAAVAQASDLEAAGLEVEDAHREALAKVAEADRRTSAAERSAREAEQRAAASDRDRREAEELAEDALAELESIRAQAAAEIEAVREHAAAANHALREEIAGERAEHAQELAEHTTAVDQHRAAAEAAQLDAAAANSAKDSAEEALAREIDTTTELRAQLDSTRQEAHDDRVRQQASIDDLQRSRQQTIDELATVRLQLATATAEADAARQAGRVEHDNAEAARRDVQTMREEIRSERDALRASHAEQIAHVQRAADQRAEALTQAVQSLQAQLARTEPPAIPRGPSDVPPGETGAVDGN